MFTALRQNGTDYRNGENVEQWQNMDEHNMFSNLDLLQYFVAFKCANLHFSYPGLLSFATDSLTSVVLPSSSNIPPQYDLFIPIYRNT